ncbi:hypothetical protein CFD26_100263 [Aspergillus turcosus]|uniref:Uncharacterized protein n=1 Tax=Aspergillus turcosus TaxID=1245748 RepID=A0A421D2K7_9EURO|nr:hypothetical protein CFD26_100263 [Aspergillus turcosus]
MSPVDRPLLSLWARDVVGDLKSAPNTFSSWDNCMAKAYCKWPVIVGIIIGAVILISVIASKYLDDPGYHQPPPMPANDVYRPPPGPPVYRGAQVARFNSPTSPPAAKVNEDALPAMPSWNDAVTRRVEDDSPQDAMEMEPLNPAHQDYQRVQSPGRFNSPGQMGVPPIRTQTSSPGYFHASSPYDDERSLQLATTVFDDAYGDVTFHGDSTSSAVPPTLPRHVKHAATSIIQRNIPEPSYVSTSTILGDESCSSRSERPGQAPEYPTKRAKART